MNCLLLYNTVFDFHTLIGYVCDLVILSCPSTEFGLFRPPEFDGWICWDSLVSILSMPSVWWTTLLKYLSVKRKKPRRLRYHFFFFFCNFTLRSPGRVLWIVYTFIIVMINITLELEKNKKNNCGILIYKKATFV